MIEKPVLRMLRTQSAASPNKWERGMTAFGSARFKGE